MTSGPRVLARVLAVSFACGVSSHGAIEAAELAGVVTELRVGTGAVRVKSADATAWTVARPLMSLYPGDQIRADGDSRTAVLLIGGAVKLVTAKESPFTIQPPGAEHSATAMNTVLTNAARLLASKYREPTMQLLGSRVGSERGEAPLIASPRETRLLTAPATFVWSGPRDARYAIEIVGPRGRQWVATNLAGPSVRYPADASVFGQGVRYRWILSTPGHAPTASWFEIARDQDVAELRSTLALADNAAADGVSASTAVIVRATLLARNRFLQAATDELEQALKTRQDDAALWFVLGTVYEQAGLSDQASTCFERARTLTDQR